MDALAVFDLNKGYSLEELRRAYRKKSKEFHPDRNFNPLESHLSMIKINHAYQELRSRLDLSEENPQGIQGEDPYEIYRRGMDLLQSVHPSKWKKVNRKDLFNAHGIETHPNTVEILQGLIQVLAEAYHCFSQVVNHYPENEWSMDSKARLFEIEKRSLRYYKILKSYQEERG